jgi:hypothetical protein
MFAATVLATYDEEFYNDYKGMIEMMIRDYANPSDSDSEYCRFRAYDLYEGHSWAGGYADNDSGNNQESASESLFSWVSMYLWGVLTENDTYRDAGVFGFTNEMEAVEQYWFDYDKDNWIDEWPYEVVGQVYGGINFYGTFFGGQPLYVYGIQWLPVSEYLTYYGMNQQRSAEIYQGLLSDTDTAMNKATKAANNEGKSQTEIEKMLKEYPQADTGWQHITWPYLSLTNSDLALEKFNANADNVQKTDTANTYWFINAEKQLGVKTTDIIATGECSSSVYYNSQTNKYTATVWNPTNKTKVVTFNNASGKIGTATIGAKSLVSFEVYKDKSFNIRQAETPEISIPSGEYDDTQFVTIKTATEGATIYYTVDGTMPTEKSSVYDGTIAVSSTATVKAIAVKDGFITSAMASSTITVNGTAVSKKTNIALGKEVTVSSSENASVGGDKIVDNDTSTRWSSDFSDNEWAQINLGKTYTINKVTLNWEASYAKGYKIQTSEDGKNWNTVYETSNGKGGEEEIIFDATSCQYVRLLGTKRALTYGYSLWEMGVYEAATVQNPKFSLASGTYSGSQNIEISSDTKGVEIRYTTDGSTPNENSKLYVPTVKINKTTTIKAIAYRKGMVPSEVSQVTYTIGDNAVEATDENLAKGKATTQSGSESTAMNSENAVDGNTGTRWSSNFSDDAWITVDLGKTYSVNKVVLNWEGAYGKAYRIQTSTDGNSWTTVKSVTDGNGGTDTLTFTSTEARYVRMQGVTRALPYGYSLWEMEVYGAKSSSGTSGGSDSSADVSSVTNLAKYATASGSENNGMDAANAVDGNTGTRWSSNFSDDAWITVDLGKIYSVNKVVLNWEGAYGKAYKIQTSTDGNSWITVKNVTDGAGGKESVTFTSTEARYVRMQGVTRALPYGYSLWEMEVYGASTSGTDNSNVASGTNVAKSAVVTSSGAESGSFLVKNAVDGDAGTRWSSNYADDAWMTVDLGREYTINKVVLNWEGAYGKAYKIQVSTDGKTWSTVKNETSGQGGIETVTFDAVSARYVKMQGVTRALPYGYSLWEMEVYTK